MITPTQIRMARSALMLSSTELAQQAGIHPNTVAIAEARGVAQGSNAVLQLFFQEAGIVFSSAEGHGVQYFPQTKK